MTEPSNPGPSNAAWALTKMYASDVRACVYAAMPEEWQRAVDQRVAEDAQRAAEQRDAENAQRRNRGGRKPAADPRTARVTVRFTAGERAILAEMAGAGDVGDYIRRAVMGRHVRARIHVPPVNGEAWTALAGALSNLNQLTRLANGTQELPTDLVPVLAALRADVLALRADLLGQGDQP